MLWTNLSQCNQELSAVFISLQSSLSYFVSGFPAAWIALQQVILKEVSLTKVKKLILIADILRSKRRRYLNFDGFFQNTD
jgi:hypothetical protein